MRVRKLLPETHNAHHIPRGSTDSEEKMPLRTNYGTAKSKWRISLRHSQHIKSILCNRLQTVAKKYQTVSQTTRPPTDSERTVNGQWLERGKKKTDSLHQMNCTFEEFLLKTLLVFFFSSSPF